MLIARLFSNWDKKDTEQETTIKVKSLDTRIRKAISLGETYLGKKIVPFVPMKSNNGFSVLFEDGKLDFVPVDSQITEIYMKQYRGKM